ncbi:hypothetical protein L202_05991 [Cryptococcus amylolentus CBS 6039]|uniref:NmrA-like domain-containing protein n=1 Tax=Cryptococcus amylolentus CBS 6039 TaxID=1295533 RepID=A0A1E3HIT3_9TREE|nr:hypothetical protein L202_05991 [Cryptococcus amylolentus CBS 6039]ODN76045.1 hypothetical protein L202_05991 [Cryptococcus amylolentus CBS 6039]
MGKSVFLTAVTGYIGGTVFQSILDSPNPPSKVTALIRDSTKADALTSLNIAKQKGVTVVPLVGSLEEHDKIRDAAADADVVIQSADADDLEGTKAILEGLKIRRDKTGHRPLLIHTSGTGVLADDARGEYPTDKIYTDLNASPATRLGPELHSIAKIPETAPHRIVDLEIVKADAAGIIKSYIVLPSTVWGYGTGEVFDKGISHPTSIQLPQLIEIAIKRGRVGVVGKGANIWNHVNIQDLGRLYGLIWQKAAVERPTIGHGTSGYYFGVAGDYTLFGAASAIGQSLRSHKALPESAETTPSSFTEEEIQQYFKGSYYSGTNSRGAADRSKSIGWTPKYVDQAQFYQDIDEEVQRLGKVAKASA